MNYKGETIHLKELWSLEIISKNDDEIPTGMFFDTLDHLFLEIHDKFTEKWVQFLENQVNVVSSFIISAKDLTKSQLLTIAEKLPHLRTLDFNSNSQFTADDILSVMFVHEDVTMFRFKVHMNEKEQTILAQTLPMDWIIDNWFLPLNSENAIVIFTLKR